MAHHFVSAGALQKASGAKTKFMLDMFHDLRAPLNVIIGFSQLMLDEVPGPINATQRQCLNDILSSSQRLLDLINDIPDLSKIDAKGGRDVARAKTRQASSFK